MPLEHSHDWPTPNRMISRMSHQLPTASRENPSLSSPSQLLPSQPLTALKLTQSHSENASSEILLPSLISNTVSKDLSTTQFVFDFDWTLINDDCEHFAVASLSTSLREEMDVWYESGTAWPDVVNKAFTKLHTDGVGKKDFDVVLNSLRIVSIFLNYVVNACSRKVRLRCFRFCTRLKQC